MSAPEPSPWIDLDRLEAALDSLEFQMTEWQLLFLTQWVEAGQPRPHLDIGRRNGLSGQLPQPGD